MEELLKSLDQQWRSQPKNLEGAKKLGGGKIFYFRLATAFCLEYRLSKHKMTRYFKNLRGSIVPWPPPGYACVDQVQQSESRF